jgi:ABC-type Na+ efflux pump permease subunit
MKKILLLILTILLLINCAGRKSNLELKNENKTEKTSETIDEKSVVNSDLSKNTTTETATGSTISEEKKETAKTEEVKESTSQKSAAETSRKSLKRKTYFENGNLKSETDYTENFSKIESENETLKSKINTQSETITDLQSENKTLQRISDNQKITIANERSKNAKSQSEKKESSKIKNKQTEREGSPFWMYFSIILFVYSILVTAILKFKM